MMTELVTVRERRRGGHVVHRPQCRIVSRVHVTALSTIPSTAVQQLNPPISRCTICSPDFPDARHQA